MKKQKIKIITSHIAMFFVLMLMFSSVFTALSKPVYATASQVRITELMYDPPAPHHGNMEFLEIYNGSDTTANLGGHYLYGVTFTFPAGSTLGPGQYGVIVRNLAVFNANKPGVRVFGQYIGKLRGSGETTQLIGSGQTLSSASYTFGNSWPTTRDGGASLSLIRPTANETLASCWAASAAGGTPGASNGVLGGGCSDKAYPITASTPSSPSTPTNSNNSAASTPEEVKKQKIEEAKKKEKAKADAKAKVEAETAKKVAEEIALAEEQATNNSKRNLLIASLVTLSILAAVGVILARTKMFHQHKFKKMLDSDSEKEQKKTKK
jgi:hypothetical protein